MTASSTDYRHRSSFSFCGNRSTSLFIKDLLRSTKFNEQGSATESIAISSSYKSYSRAHILSSCFYLQPQSFSSYLMAQPEPHQTSMSAPQSRSDHDLIHTSCIIILDFLEIHHHELYSTTIQQSGMVCMSFISGN